ncbi:MAG: diguanylate cyclase [Ruminococcus sp.]|nr:diguanylate cyclase [Ruminococcus sp.]
MRGSRRISAITLLLIIQLIVMIILSLIFASKISSATRENSIQHLQTITDERAHIIKTYVQNSERILTYYSKASQVSELLKKTDDSGARERAQAYTEDYSADIENLEGIYVSTWDTKVLVHSSPDVVGMITRKDPESLKQLQEALLAAGSGVYDTGMIISPASGKQIVSMYKAVYDDNGKPVGFVGLGIYTSRLIETLDRLSLEGAGKISYSMVNVNDCKYVFNKKNDLVGKVAENKHIKAICENNEGKNSPDSGSFEYRSGGKKYISIYSYIPEYGWLLLLDKTKKDVYSLTNVLRAYIALFGLAIAGLVILFSFFNKKQEKVNQKLASTIVKNDKTKESLYTAMFKDVLTETGNRISFSMSLEEANKRKAAYYFAMFNIDGFSGINAGYGNDVGDWLLIKTAETIKQVFRDGKVFRTGSDEFVAAVPASDDIGPDDVTALADDAYQRLTAPQTSPAGRLSFPYRASVVRKKSDINTSVIAVMKEMINTEPNAVYGQINYKDMDAE